MSGISVVFSVEVDFGIDGFRVRDNDVGRNYDALDVFPLTFFVFCVVLFCVVLFCFVDVFSLYNDFCCCRLEKVTRRSSGNPPSITFASLRL